MPVNESTFHYRFTLIQSFNKHVSSPAFCAENKPSVSARYLCL